MLRISVRYPTTFHIVVMSHMGTAQTEYLSGNENAAIQLFQTAVNLDASFAEVLNVILQSNWHALFESFHNVSFSDMFLGHFCPIMNVFRKAVIYFDRYFGDISVSSCICSAQGF